MTTELVLPRACALQLENSLCSLQLEKAHESNEDLVWPISFKKKKSKPLELHWGPLCLSQVSPYLKFLILITYAKTYLPCKVTYKFWELEHERLWQGLGIIVPTAVYRSEIETDRASLLLKQVLYKT